MSSKSFKRAFDAPPQGYRTPSPPPIELISPSSWSNNNIASRQREGSASEGHGKTKSIRAHGNTEDDTESEDEVVGVPTGLIQNSAAIAVGQVPAIEHPTTIDTLATLALATSPKYASEVNLLPHLGSFSPPKPVSRPLRAPVALPASQLTYVGHQATEERPSKRVRSEAVVTTAMHYTEPRPATMYTGNGHWSPASGYTPRAYAGPPLVGDSSISDSMSNDAELLLNLARTTTFSPETGTPRMTHLVNGQHQATVNTSPSSNLPQGQELNTGKLQEGIVPEAMATETSPKPIVESEHSAYNVRGPVDGLEPNAIAPELAQVQKVAEPRKDDMQGLETETPAPFVSASDSVRNSIELGLGNVIKDNSSTTNKMRTNHRGWPKGKPRGPRKNWAGQKTGKDQSGGSAGASNKPRRQTARRKDAKYSDILRAACSRGYNDTLPTAHRRQTSLPLDLQPSSRPSKRRHSTSEILNGFDGRLWIKQSVKSQHLVPDAQSISSNSSLGSGGSHNKRLKSLQTAVCAECNFTRNALESNDDFNATSWISCNGCKSWFHFACAGFKSEREVRSVDKYICRDCRPSSGPTTFVRKSTRAHTAIDYAGLNEGVVKSSDENHEHHYIKPIKEGKITFLPENFARMRPELVTAEFFEKGNGMKEPVVIPAWMNPRPPDPAAAESQHSNITPDSPNTQTEEFEKSVDTEVFRDYEFEYVPDEGQDALDMVIPQNLTVRRVAELYGPEEKVEVIDVKSQEGEDKKWNMRRWADYYESQGEKVVRNVISLEVSSSKLGRLIRRPEIVRKLDLQDSVWPAESLAKGEFPRVQFYCLMSVADCFTDFHIDFGGSSVFYHILKGKKTFLFIPPKNKHLKKYEEWCLSPAQNWTFLPDQTKECYRVDLSEGDTMLIPSGWIHAVWTPENSLVIGGNFLTRMHFGMQIRIAEIEKNTKVARKFRYPHFQKIQWLTAIRYLEDDPLPGTVIRDFYDGESFYREIPAYYEFDKYGANSKPGLENYQARYYSQYELEGLPDLARYLLRTALISMGSISDGITTETRNAVARSIPKGHGEPLEIAKKFAMWSSWKRGNECIPHWAHPDAVPVGGALGANEKKLSAAAIKRLEREAAIEAYRVAPERQSARKQVQAEAASSKPAIAYSKPPSVGSSSSQRSGPESPISKPKLTPLSTPKTSVLGPKRIACDGCRKRRVRCKHKGPHEITLGDVRRNTAIAVVITSNASLAQDEYTPTNDVLSDSKLSNGINQEFAEGATDEAQVDNIAVEVWRNSEPHPTSITDQQQDLRMATAVVKTSPTSLETSSLSSHTKLPKKQPLNGEVAMAAETSHDKKSRNKACKECRKSKRRCVHDESGNIDPIKVQESPLSRGISSKKRLHPTALNGEVHVTKRPKINGTEDLAQARASIDARHTHPKLTLHDNLTSFQSPHDLTMGVESCYDEALLPTTDSPTVLASPSPHDDGTIRLEPVNSLIHVGIKADVDPSVHVTQGEARPPSSPEMTVLNGKLTQNCVRRDIEAEDRELGNEVEVPEAEVQRVKMSPNLPAVNNYPEIGDIPNKADDSGLTTRQDCTLPESSFEASKAPVQGATQSMESKDSGSSEDIHEIKEKNASDREPQTIVRTLPNTTSQSHITNSSTLSPPLTPVMNHSKPPKVNAIVSRRSSRQPKEIQRFSAEQSNGVHNSEKPSSLSNNASTTEDNGASRSPDLHFGRKSLAKSMPSRQNGNLTKTPRTETVQRSNEKNGMNTNGSGKRAKSELNVNGRGSTGEVSSEEDEDMRLARTLQEMEFGLRRRSAR